MSDSRKKVTYQPFSSILNPGFWQQLTNVKLNDLKLNTGPVKIRGSYSHGLSSNLPCLASFDHASFNQTGHAESQSNCPMYGQLICMNVMQDMIEFDKKSYLETIGDEIWQSICDGRALENPEEHLSRFGLLVYADLKRYKFVYWFNFPAINYPSDVSNSNSDSKGHLTHQSITEIFNETALNSFHEQFESHRPARSFQRGYFIVAHDKRNHSAKCLPLTDYKRIAEKVEPSTDIYFAFSDPSPNLQHPGWPLRNFLALISVQLKLNHVKIIRVRRGQPTVDHKSYYHHSLVFEVNFQRDENDSNISRPVVTGWERNESQQMAPKRVNLSSLLDPIKLAEDAVNLNLKLMKWRLVPGLELERIANTRCLLLGCGTLGCHIARGLLAWGVKSIGLLDNSKVSYSNPVRQTLYTSADCISKNPAGGTGLFKSEAAAASLKSIHPTVVVESHVLSIPMPGHHVVQNDIEQTKQDIEKLEGIIDRYDVIFLLMDTRESRWLPTVIGMSKKKLIINAAIGFDTFLLQRFGIRDYSQLEQSSLEQRDQQPSTSKPSNDNSNQLDCDKLGCYFCNDIVAPGNSTSDRTLDQQCTVSRPGVSMLVSALAVEFMASIISSPSGCRTPAPMDTHSESSMEYELDTASELGIVPHSIRGNISRYHIYMPTSPCFNKCSACSPAVIRSYLEQKHEFLIKVFNDPSHLEEIAGLKDLKNVSDDVWALDSDEMTPDEYSGD